MSKETKKLIFPLALPARAMVLGRSAITIMLDLACNDPDLWIALVADGKDEQGEVVGRKIARANAINKVWPLMGYELKQRLHEQSAKVPA